MNLIDLRNQFGLDFVVMLQSQQSDLLEALALLLHNLGANLLFLAALSLIYWSFNRKFGIQLLIALIISGLLTSLLKFIFQIPRPLDVTDQIIPLIEETGFGFPSGHVLINTFVWGYAGLQLRQRWIYAALAVYLLGMAWSRLYLGVHLPLDVLAGFVFGLLGLYLYLRLAGPFERWWKNLSVWGRAALSTAVAILVILAPYDEAGVAIAGLLVGTVAGLEIEARYVRFDDTSNPRLRLLRYLLGGVLILAAFYGLRLLNDESSSLFIILRALRYALVALLAACLWPWIGQRIGLFGQRDHLS